MADLGRFTAAAISATNENTLALASLNFDFSLFKIDAPKEFQQLGQRLSPWRRTAAESGSTHKTARKLGALFEQITPPADELYRAYGERVSQISASEVNNPKGWRKHGMFENQVGADGTAIWAAATSGKAAIAMNLLACMLARMWPASKATSIWFELVDERKNEVQRGFVDGEPAHMAALAAAQQDITRKELAEWDASARAWISVANRAKEREHNKMEDVLVGLTVPVDSSVEVYTSVIRAWNTAMSTMSRLIAGMPQRFHSGAILIAISAWHLYPDIDMFGPLMKSIVQGDPLVRFGGRLTVGLEDPNPERGHGVNWSLSLAHTRYYGEPVLSTTYCIDESKVPFDDFTLAALGSVFASWAGKHFNPTFDQLNGAQFIVGLWEYFEAAIDTDLTREETDAARKFVTIRDNWMFILVSAARRLLDDKARDSSRAKRLVSIGVRRGLPLVGGNKGMTSPYFGLCEPTNILKCAKDSRAKVATLRQLAKIRNLGDSDVIISYRDLETDKIEFATVVPMPRRTVKRRHGDHELPTCGHVRWIVANHADYETRKTSIELDGELCLTYNQSDIQVSFENQSLSWYNPPSCLSAKQGPNGTDSRDISEEGLHSRSSGRVVPSTADNMVSDDILSWEEAILEFDRWHPDRTQNFNCVLGDVTQAAVLVRQDGAHGGEGDGSESRTLSPKEMATIFDSIDLSVTSVIEHLTITLEPYLAAPLPVASSMKALAAAAKIYKLMPGAPTALRLLERDIGSSKWAFSCKRKHTHCFAPYKTNLAESLACAVMFDAGSLDIEVAELKNVLAISSGNSIYAASLLLSDPHERCGEFELTRIVGNIGRAGVTMLIPPADPRIIKPGPERWLLVNHAGFDSTCEDRFDRTSLHLSFTGYEQAMASTIIHGAQDVEARYMEALISVYDGSRKIADLDVLSGLNSGLLKRLELPSDCNHKATARMRWIAIDSWDELLEMKDGIGIIRAHGNSLARLAACVLAIQKGVSACFVLPQEVCYGCVLRERMVNMPQGIVLIC